jgi:hypothetical protein
MKESQEYEIVDGLQAPEFESRRTYPFFGELEVGQCAIVDVGPRQNSGESNNDENALRVAASQRNRRSDKTFVVRIIPDKENHVGVWRVE